MEKHLHIVSFDVPWPVDSGGVVDIFSTITALHQAGIGVHLHCFDCGRGEQRELNNYCSSVRYYPRLTGHKCVSAQLPFVVASRSAPELLENLLQDDHPILLHGIQCTFLLNDQRFSQRRIAVRLQHTLHGYYKQLSQATPVVYLLKKLYYNRESNVLKHYEEHIMEKAFFLALSEEHASQYRCAYASAKVAYLPPFLPFTQVTAQEGVGCFCMYHGNLSVPENEQAALWLLEKVFHELPVPLIIAGKNPSKRLERKALGQRHACLVANPSEQELQDMISKAHIHVLPTFYRKPAHIKLFNALYNGRHCVVNEEMIGDHVLAPCCHVAGSAQAFQSVIMQLKHKPFEEHEIQLRKHLLQKYFDTRDSCRLLVSMLWA